MPAWHRGMQGVWPGNLCRLIENPDERQRLRGWAARRRVLCDPTHNVKRLFDWLSFGEGA